MLAPFHRVVAKRRVPLVVEIVEQRHDTPLFFVLAERTCVPAHGGVDRQRVLAQAVALRSIR